MFAIIPWLELSNVNFTVLDEQFGLTGEDPSIGRLFVVTRVTAHCSNL